ncbi:MAG: MarR family transcriptional regulator [Caldilineaceae bacterium]|nr:MarR family transcriptional regulator [Caldilineaceae bacterium]
MSISPDHDSPAWQILEYLQRNPSATIKDFELLLGVTTTAVRQHLNALQASGYLDRREERSGVGRPHYIYVATDAARELFACRCDDLALTMLQEMYGMVGAEKMGTLLKRVGVRLAERYAESVNAPGVQQRIEEMAGALARQGVLTDVSAGESDTIALKMYNCPYHDLAVEHREICEMDQQMLQKVLGVEVSLDDCIMDGHGSCSFVIEQSGRSELKFEF